MNIRDNRTGSHKCRQIFRYVEKAIEEDEQVKKEVEKVKENDKV